MKTKPKLPSQIVGNVGMYYVCFKLSELGWNVMPTARNAKGIDIVAYKPDGKGFLGVQVKSLSKRNPIPLGTNLDKVMGDVWCVVVRQKDDSLVTYLLSPKQIRDGAHEDGKGSWWVEPKKYELPECRENWDGHFPIQGD
ncbi:MAG: hypothetical protein J6Y56_06840 [Fibrobacterales bacterium]|nr:hypothetical protein [Fibrobacterales bacterium]